MSGWEAMTQGAPDPFFAGYGCKCFAYDADTGEEGWRPCPPELCERADHDHKQKT